VRGLVWVGDDVEGASAAWKASVDAFRGQRSLYGFYLADEPLPSLRISHHLAAFPVCGNPQLD